MRTSYQNVPFFQLRLQTWQKHINPFNFQDKVTYFWLQPSSLSFKLQRHFYQIGQNKGKNLYWSNWESFILTLNWPSRLLGRKECTGRKRSLVETNGERRKTFQRWNIINQIVFDYHTKIINLTFIVSESYFIVLTLSMVKTFSICMSGTLNKALNKTSWKYPRNILRNIRRNILTTFPPHLAVDMFFFTYFPGSTCSVSCSH